MNPTLKEYLQSAVLALIQGAAELLPVSSSAHVIFAESLMGIDPSEPRATFLLVMLHTGTMGAVLVYFWRRWKRLLANTANAGSGQPAYQFARYVALGTVVSLMLGGVLKVLIENVILERMLHHEKGEVEQLFRELPLVGGALFVVGIFIIAAGFFETPGIAKPLQTWSVGLIGLVQGLCIPFRGLSRSGATISTALFCRISRQLAEDFSFALAVALTPFAIGWELRRLLRDENWHFSDLPHMLGPALAGMVLSFFAGLGALYLLSAALEKGRWRYFGFYCLAAAAVMVGYAYTIHVR
jgi:undecaprenyl-diphosphatase